MFLCYKCFCKTGHDPKTWDTIDVDTTVRKVCEICGLKGIYVRDVKKETISYESSTNEED